MLPADMQVLIKISRSPARSMGIEVRESVSVCTCVHVSLLSRILFVFIVVGVMSFRNIECLSNLLRL